MTGLWPALDMASQERRGISPWALPPGCLQTACKPSRTLSDKCVRAHQESPGRLTRTRNRVAVLASHEVQTVAIC
jgi:hypothetical protein